MRKRLPLFESVAVIMGTIVGAGILGVPYVFAQSGFLTSIVVLVVVGSVMVVEKLLLGEITLRTPGKFQLAGYVSHYLGKGGKHTQATIMILGGNGTLLAYMIGEGEVLSTMFGGSSAFWSYIFLFAFALLIIGGLNIIKRTELIMMTTIFAILVFIAVLAYDSFSLANLNGRLELGSFFTPYGVILYACGGLVAIPEIHRILMKANRPRIMKKAILIGAILPPVLYLVFSAMVVGVTGSETTEVATVGLGEKLGPAMIFAGNIFAAFTMATSFLTYGLAIKQLYRDDYRIKPLNAGVLVALIPLIAFTAGLRDFISVISIVGAVGAGLTGILLVFVYWRAKFGGMRRPEFSIPGYVSVPLSLLLVVMFGAGIVYVFV